MKVLNKTNWVFFTTKTYDPEDTLLRMIQNLSPFYTTEELVVDNNLAMVNGMS